MSRITDHHALSQELNLAYDLAIQRFPDRTDEIDDVFEAVDEVHKSLRLIDKFIDEKDSTWAAEKGEKFMRLAEKLLSWSADSKDLFAWRSKLVSWRNAPVDNIVSAIAIEATWYLFHFDSFLSHDKSPDNEEFLLSLRTQIRRRIEKDSDAESELVEHTPRNLKSKAGKPKHVGTASGPSGQLRNNVPQPTEVSEFYRLQKLTKWQGKSKAEIHREIARRNAKETTRPWTEAELLREAGRIKKAIRDYERKVNQQQ